MTRNDDTTHWKNQDECQSCGDDEGPLRAIKMSSGNRDLLCIECFVEQLNEGKVSPEDPRVNDDGSANLGVPRAPGQTRPNKELRDE